MAQSMMLIEKCSHCVSWYDIETGERQGRLSLPDYPHEFVVDKEFKYAYVGHYGVQNSGIDGTDGQSVIVVDIEKQEVAHTYDLGEHARPHGISLDDNGRLYVLSEWTAHLLVKENPRAFDQGWDHITPTGGTKSHLFALTGDGDTAYSMNLTSGDVTMFKPYDASFAPISIKTGKKPEGRCLRADEKILYTSNRISNTVTVIDTEKLEVIRSFPTPDDPCRIYHDTKRNRLVTMNHFGGSFSVFDEVTGEELHRQETPANPLALCLDAEEDYAYIAIDCEQVQRFNLDTFEIVQTFDTGKEPDVMVILPDGFSKKWEALS
ncbi:YncE family protein [Amylibacter sp. SFDW26]|uniref:YncE family protein n=1 Tax=Amylibacter sp. SFDW26 TaxID=2652722 RepID=UPI00126209DA|nr:YncE family protein [Amylibacter sp. SFDW26]KAB7610164.1 YncE family protein [Amylibacter sp. SFDW26]